MIAQKSLSSATNRPTDGRMISSDLERSTSTDLTFMLLLLLNVLCVYWSPIVSLRESLWWLARIDVVERFVLVRWVASSIARLFFWKITLFVIVRLSCAHDLFFRGVLSQEVLIFLVQFICRPSSHGTQSCWRLFPRASTWGVVARGDFGFVSSAPPPRATFFTFSWTFFRVFFARAGPFSFCAYFLELLQ